MPSIVGALGLKLFLSMTLNSLGCELLNDGSDQFDVPATAQVAAAPQLERVDV